MKKLLYILAATSIAFSCKGPVEDHTATLVQIKDSAKEPKSTVSSAAAAPIDTVSQTRSSKDWMLTLLKNYITHSDKELIRLALKSKAREEWLFDQIIDTDTAKYYVFHIGHDVSEKDGSELRFITDQWIYIDSLTRKLYEYDLPNERLTEWRK